MPKMSLNGGEPVDVADAKVAVYESQGYALADDVADETADDTKNVVKRPAAKKTAKKAAKKS